MSKKETFMQGVAALMISQVSVKIFGMIYSLYLTNKKGFGDSGNAVSMAAFQVYAMFLTISSIGIPNAISKIVAENLSFGNYRNCKKVLRIAIFIFASIGLVSSLILYFGSDFIAQSLLGIEAASDILKVLAPSIVFVTIASVLRGYFNRKTENKSVSQTSSIRTNCKNCIYYNYS